MKQVEEVRCTSVVLCNMEDRMRRVYILYFLCVTGFENVDPCRLLCSAFQKRETCTALLSCLRWSSLLALFACLLAVACVFPSTMRVEKTKVWN